MNFGRNIAKFDKKQWPSVSLIPTVSQIIKMIVIQLFNLLINVKSQNKCIRILKKFICSQNLSEPIKIKFVWFYKSFENF